MLAQITLPAKWSYAPGPIKIVSYAPVCLASSAATPSILEGEHFHFPRGEINKDFFASEGVARSDGGV